MGFALLSGQGHTSLVRRALVYVPNRAVTQEVGQDAWLGVLLGIGGFEGRSAFETWIFRIPVNYAISGSAR